MSGKAVDRQRQHADIHQRDGQSPERLRDGLAAQTVAGFRHQHHSQHITKAAAKAEKAAAAKPEDDKLADAAARAKKAADDAAAGVAFPETFKDFLDKWVYSIKDQDELLDKIGGARLLRLKNEPHLGYSTRH